MSTDKTTTPDISKLIERSRLDDDPTSPLAATRGPMPTSGLRATPGAPGFADETHRIVRDSAPRTDRLVQAGRVPMPQGAVTLPGPTHLDEPESKSGSMTQKIRIRRVSRLRERERERRRATLAEPALWEDVAFPVFVVLLCALPAAFGAASEARWGTALAWTVLPSACVGALTVPVARWLRTAPATERRR